MQLQCYAIDEYFNKKEYISVHILIADSNNFEIIFVAHLLF